MKAPSSSGGSKPQQRKKGLFLAFDEEPPEFPFENEEFRVSIYLKDGEAPAFRSTPLPLKLELFQDDGGGPVPPEAYEVRGTLAIPAEGAGCCEARVKIFRSDVHLPDRRPILIRAAAAADTTFGDDDEAPAAAAAAVSRPLRVVRHKLCVETGDWPAVFYKDMGGKDSSLKVDVTLRDRRNHVVTDRPLRLATTLLRRDTGGPVGGGANILRVLNADADGIVSLSNGRAMLKARIEDVSMHHGNSDFFFRIDADTSRTLADADVAPASTRQVNVKSKVNNKRKDRAAAARDAAAANAAQSEETKTTTSSPLLSHGGVVVHVPGGGGSGDSGTSATASPAGYHVDWGGHQHQPPERGGDLRKSILKCQLQAEKLANSLAPPKTTAKELRILVQSQAAVLKDVFAHLDLVESHVAAIVSSFRRHVADVVDDDDSMDDSRGGDDDDGDKAAKRAKASADRASRAAARGFDLQLPGPQEQQQHVGDARLSNDDTSNDHHHPRRPTPPPLLTAGSTRTLAADHSSSRVLHRPPLGGFLRSTDSATLLRSPSEDMPPMSFWPQRGVSALYVGHDDDDNNVPPDDDAAAGETTLDVLPGEDAVAAVLAKEYKRLGVALGFPAYDRDGRLLGVYRRTSAAGVHGDDPVPLAFVSAKDASLGLADADLRVAGHAYAEQIANSSRCVFERAHYPDLDTLIEQVQIYHQNKVVVFAIEGQHLPASSGPGAMGSDAMFFTVEEEEQGGRHGEPPP